MGNGYKYRRLSKDDAVVLLIDHQSGLISLVQDYSPNEFKNNVLALADVGLRPVKWSIPCFGFGRGGGPSDAAQEEAHP